MDIANAEEDEDEEEEEDEDHVVRAIFEDNLRKAGLEMELEPSRVSELAYLHRDGLRWEYFHLLETTM